MTDSRMTAVRKSLRKLVHRLPDREQLLIRRMRAALGPPDWAEAVSRVRRRDAALIEETAREARGRHDRRRVLVCVLQQLPPVAEISYTLASALHLRGHEVAGVLCDGVLPMCEMTLGHLDRPSCGSCATWVSRFESAFGFQFARLTSLVDAADRARAEQLVDATSEAGLLSLIVDGVPVGVLARRELQRYHRGFSFDPASDPAFRAWLVAGVLLVKAAERLFDRERPDILVISSGRTLLAGSLSAVAQARGIRAVSWDLENSHPDGLTFSHDEPAVLLPLDDAWARVKDEPLRADERERLHSFLDTWARGDSTPFAYNPRPLGDRDQIRTTLGLRPGAPLIAAFANAAWDMAAVDRDAGFRSMFDWLFALVEYAVAHPDIDLVVRAHPAEVNVPADLRSRTPVVAEIRRRFPSLPTHIVLLDGDSPVSSYALADLAQAPVMYATRLGLEMAVRGRRAWIAGQTTYRGRGFTRDIASRPEMDALLNARTFDERLSPDEIALAERFANLWFFRYVVRVPLLRPGRRPFSLSSFRELAPGGHPVLDRICEAITQGTPFLDLAMARRAELHV